MKLIKRTITFYYPLFTVLVLSSCKVGGEASDGSTASSTSTSVSSTGVAAHTHSDYVQKAGDSMTGGLSTAGDISTLGKLGVGIVPTARFHVYDHAQAYMKFDSTAALSIAGNLSASVTPSMPVIKFLDSSSGGTMASSFGYHVNTGLSIRNQFNPGSESVYFEHAIDPSMLMITGGFGGYGSPSGVGIGTSAPTGTRLKVKSGGNTSASKAFEIDNSSNTTLLTVLDNGNVGIGKNNPTDMLHVAGSTGVAGSSKSVTIENTGPAERVNLILKTNNGWSNLVSFERSGITWADIGVQWGSGTFDLRALNNNPMVMATGGSERMRISAVGDVGIGTATAGYKLQVGNAADGTEARANAWNLLSDERLKRNFEEIPDSLEKILRLNGYYYEWNRGPDRSRKMGVKAQEVEKVFPEVVSVGRDGFKSISYDHLIAPIINAIKELYMKVMGTSEEVKQASREIARLKSENEALKSYLCSKDPKAPFCTVKLQSLTN